MTDFCINDADEGGARDVDDTKPSIATMRSPAVSVWLESRTTQSPVARTRRHEYEARIASKRWRELWPKVRFLE